MSSFIAFATIAWDDLDDCASVLHRESDSLGSQVWTISFSKSFFFFAVIVNGCTLYIIMTRYWLLQKRAVRVLDATLASLKIGGNRRG